MQMNTATSTRFHVMAKQMKSIISMLVLVSLAGTVNAQENQKKDNTGTNPINFSNDFRISYNRADLNTKGDGSASNVILEYKYPISEKWQFRTRLRSTSKKIDLTNYALSYISGQ